jgi:peptidoglycan/LPS O-acetylase OafA/YrhL
MRRIAVLASLVAGLVMVCQPARADDLLFLLRNPKIDQRVATVGLVVGLGSTAAYFIARDGHHGTDWGAYGAATVGCMALAPIIAGAVVRERQLTTREVLVMEGSCVIPVVGGFLVNALFDANPQWEAPPPRVAVKRRVRR